MREPDPIFTPVSVRQDMWLLLDFEQAQVALGLIVVEGDGQIVEEGEHLVLREQEAFEQVARQRLLDPAALMGATGRRRIGRESSGQERLIAGD